VPFRLSARLYGMTEAVPFRLSAWLYGMTEAVPFRLFGVALPHD